MCHCFHTLIASRGQFSSPWKKSCSVGVNVLKMSCSLTKASPVAQWLHNVLAAIPNILNLEKQFRDLVYDNFSRFVEDVG